MNDSKKDYLVEHMCAAGSLYDNYLTSNEGFFSKNIFKRFLQKLGLMKKEKLSASEYLSLNVISKHVSGDIIQGEITSWENNLWVNELVPLEKQVTIKGGIYALTSRGVYGPHGESKEFENTECHGLGICGQIKKENKK